MQAPAPANDVVISQVYGGGGNTGSTLKNDYIELINHSGSPVNLNGWSVQAYVVPQTGTPGWQMTPLTNFTLQPGQYYLVQESQGAGGTDNLPAADAIGTIPVSSTSTKVALVNNTTLITAVCPDAGTAGVVDLVGYGPTDCFEGSGTAPTLSNTTAALRLNEGCWDTNDNSVDFVSGAPNPRNTSTPTHNCTGLSAIGSANPSTVPQGNSTTLTVKVAPAQNPTSSGLAVTADLTLIGGSANQSFACSGTTFTYFATIPANNPSGMKSLPVTVTDGQGRTVDFRNTIIIMTSNIGSTYLVAGNMRGAEEFDAAVKLVMEALHGNFKPEFLNRVDDIIVFRPLGKDQLVKIVDLRLEDLRRFDRSRCVLSRRSSVGRGSRRAITTGKCYRGHKYGRNRR